MSDSLQFDLLPREYAAPRQNREINLSIAVAIALLVGLRGALSNVSASLLEGRQGETRDRINRLHAPEMAALRSGLSELGARGRRLTQILRKRSFSHRQLGSITEAFRGKAWLTQLKYESDAQLLSLAGYALRSRDLPELMAGLWRIRSLTDLRTVSVTRQSVGGREVIAFLLTARQADSGTAATAVRTGAAR